MGEAPQMRFQYGPLAAAMRFGHVLVLNEVDLADAGELAGLNDVLEGRPLVLAENAGEIIRPHPMFRVICTANSCGNGDDSGRYAGVQQQNLAFLDRFRSRESRCRWTRSRIEAKTRCSAFERSERSFT